MQFATPFDARTVEPASFAPPPILADYHVKIIDSEAKPTTDGTGGYLELTLEILDPGPYVARKIPYRLNLYNKNTQTMEIAYRQLSAVCHVISVFSLQDSRQLHNLPFIATIGPQANNPQYANVFAVKDLNGVAPGSKTAAPAALPAQPPIQPPPQAPPAAAAPAWAPPGASAAPAWVAPVWSGSAAPVAAAPAAAPPWGAAAPSSKPPWEK